MVFTCAASPPESLNLEIPSLLEFLYPSVVGWGGERVFSRTALLLLVFVNKTLHGNGK